MSKKDKKGRVLHKGEVQRKDGRFQFRTQKDGRIMVVYGNTLAEMREKKDFLLRQIASGMDVIRQHTTLNEIVDAYLEMKRQTVQESTYCTMKFSYDLYVRNGLGKKKIIDIRHSMVKTFYLSLLKEREISISTVSRVDSVIKPAFETAVNDDIIMKNPATGVCGEIKRELHARPQSVSVPTPEEQRRWLDFVMKNPKCSGTLKNLLTVICGTGLRVGEAVALSWDSIDFENRMIDVNKAIAYIKDENGHAKQLLKKPKSVAGIRKIPMIRQVREALERELEYQRNHGLDQIVWEGVTGLCFLSRQNKPFTREMVNTQIRKMIAEYNEQAEEGKQIQRFSTHALRHTFATALCQSTTDLKAIQEIMGHSDISMTMNVYAQATEQTKVNSMEAFENKMGGG